VFAADRPGGGWADARWLPWRVRQLDAVAARVLAGAAAQTLVVAGVAGPVLVDLDDTIVEVHGYAKQGAGFGYTGVRAVLEMASSSERSFVLVVTLLR
jgi:hypothetical protein